MRKCTYHVDELTSSNFLFAAVMHQLPAAVHSAMSGLVTAFAAFQIAHINYVSFRTNQSAACAAAFLHSQSVEYPCTRRGGAHDPTPIRPCRWNFEIGGKAPQVACSDWLLLEIRCGVLFYIFYFCVFLQCFEPLTLLIGWVIWPVKTRPRYDL